MKLKALLAIAALLSGPAFAEGETLKVQNGVTVKSGTPQKQVMPEDRTATEAFTTSIPSAPVQFTQDTSTDTKFPDIDYRGPSAPTPAEIEPAASSAPQAAEKVEADKVFMKPIVEQPKPEPKIVKLNSEPAKTESTKTETPVKTEAKKIVAKTEKKTETKPVVKAEAKTVDSEPSPFKKSQDADVKETVKKPDPSPQVTAQPLSDDISSDIKNLDKVKSGEMAEVEKKEGESGLPIPRFVTLKSGEANARSGPGDTYPIRWVYQRKNLPVEVTAEFKLWRRIKDIDGEQTWVHQALLSSRRSGILINDATAQSQEEGGSPTARFKKGVQVKISECTANNCHVEYGRIEGWLKKKDIWGVYASEVFD